MDGANISERNGGYHGILNRTYRAGTFVVKDRAISLCFAKNKDDTQNILKVLYFFYI